VKLLSKISLSVRSAPLAFWLGATSTGALVLVALLLVSGVTSRTQRKAAERLAFGRGEKVDELFKNLYLDDTKAWLKSPQGQPAVDDHEVLLMWIDRQIQVSGSSREMKPLVKHLHVDGWYFLVAYQKWRDELELARTEFGLKWPEQSPVEISVTAAPVLAELNRSWAAFRQYYKTEPQSSAWMEFRSMVKQLILVRLQGPTRPEGTAAQWQELAQMLRLQQIISDVDLTSLLEAWFQLDEMRREPYLSGESARSRIAILLNSPRAPEWLQEEARQLLVEADKRLSNEKNKTKEKEPTATITGPPEQLLDDPSASHNIQIEITDLSGTKDFEVDALSGWIKEAKMHLLVGEAGDSQDKLEKWSDPITPGLFARGKMSVADKAIRIEAGKLKLPQGSQQKSWRIVGESGSSGKVAFELIVVPSDPLAQGRQLLSLNRSVTAKISSNVGGASISGQAVSMLHRLKVRYGSSFVITSGETEFQLNRNGALKASPTAKRPDASLLEIRRLEDEIKNIMVAIHRIEKEIHGTDFNFVGGEERLAEKEKFLDQKRANLEQCLAAQKTLRSSANDRTSSRIGTGLYEVILNHEDQRFLLFRADICN